MYERQNVQTNLAVNLAWDLKIYNVWNYDRYNLIWVHNV
jgi:hypothetical protein